MNPKKMFICKWFDNFQAASKEMLVKVNNLTTSHHPIGMDINESSKIVISSILPMYLQ